jgi:hypothetical protein
VAGNADLFTPEAIARVSAQARGNPRDLVELAGRALDRALQEGIDQIDSAVIDRVLTVGERGVVTNQLGLFDTSSPRKRELARSGAGERVELNAS